MKIRHCCIALLLGLAAMAACSPSVKVVELVETTKATKERKMRNKEKRRSIFCFQNFPAASKYWTPPNRFRRISALQPVARPSNSQLEELPLKPAYLGRFQEISVNKYRRISPAAQINRVHGLCG